MKRKRKRKEFKRPRHYREDYQTYLGREISWKYDVHHIDGNVWNSEVSNLVAIPKDLHELYHNTKDAGGDTTRIHYRIMVFKENQEKSRSSLI